MKRWGQILPGLLLAIGGLWLLWADIPPVTVTWETASEVGTAGFNVYRSPVGTDDAEQVNLTLIPAHGDEVIGSKYRVEDTDVAAGKRYTYHIEEVEWDGTHTTYPETVTVRAGLPQTWTKVEGVVMLVIAVVLIYKGMKS